jgi:hypothetical protein
MRGEDRQCLFRRRLTRRRRRLIEHQSRCHGHATTGVDVQNHVQALEEPRRCNARAEPGVTDRAWTQRAARPTSDGITRTAWAATPPGRQSGGISGRDGVVELWNVAKRKQFASPRGGIGRGRNPRGFPISSVAFSTGGSILAGAGKNGDVALWDVVTRSEIGPPAGYGKGSAIDSLAFSPDFKFN